MVTHRWILKIPELLGVATNVRELFWKSMEKWRTVMQSGTNKPERVNIEQRISKG